MYHNPTSTGTGGGAVIANGVAYYFDGSVTDMVNATTGAFIAQITAGASFLSPVVSEGRLYTPGSFIAVYGV